MAPLDTFYSVFEANIADEAADTKPLPEVQKLIEKNHGARIAGGFNKAKLIDGKTPVNNRYVIIRWDSEADFRRAQTGGVKAWIEKNAPEARQILVEGVEQK